MVDESPLMIRIRRHVARICAVDPSTIRSDGKLVGYGLDSIRAMELILTLEEQLDIEIAEHDPALARVETLRDLVQLVRRRSEESNP